MNGTIAFSVVCFILGIFLIFIAGVFKIFILKGFELNKKWFDFKPKFEYLFFRKENEPMQKKILLALYTLFSFSSFFLFSLGLIGLTIIILR